MSTTLDDTQRLPVLTAKQAPDYFDYWRDRKEHEALVSVLKRCFPHTFGRVGKLYPVKWPIQ